VKISSIQAADRFPNTEFSNEVVDGMALPLTTAYTCSQCSTQIGFHKRDFESGARQHRSNLEPGVARMFDEFAHEHMPDARDYLDWACPRCGLAARVYVRFWAGGKHGDAGVSLLTVVEAQPDRDEVRG
jgi:hypothetical protein